MKNLVIAPRMVSRTSSGGGTGPAVSPSPDSAAELSRSCASSAVPRLLVKMITLSEK